jgi:hypothetical protein
VLIGEEQVTSRELEARLRAELPPGIAGLEPEHLSDLLTLIEAARRAQAAELREAGDRAFGFIPRLLRGPIRAIMR